MSRQPVVLAVLLAAVTAVACVVSVVGLLRPGPAIRAIESADPPAEATVVQRAASRTAALDVLRRWDADRAAAWAAGDPRALAALYVPGSRAGRRDRAMLGSWTRRGLVVEGLTTQLLGVHEIRRTARTWVLRVTDRLAGGLAVAPGLHRTLPDDAATTRTVTLSLVDGAWRVDSVRVAGQVAGRVAGRVRTPRRDQNG